IDTENEDPSPTTPQYIEHTIAGTAPGQKDVGPVWSFNWTAPPAGSGTVTFWVSGNAANNDQNNTGDFIYNTPAASPEASAVQIVYGDLTGDGKINVQDATLALQFSVGLKTPTADQLAAGDVAPVPGSGPRAGEKFGDGKINLQDATRILRRAV